MKFPIGGKVRARNCMNRCNSGTDSIVWMKEDVLFFEIAAVGVFCLPSSPLTHSLKHNT